MLINDSQVEELVCDPFMGSGTTLLEFIVTIEERMEPILTSRCDDYKG